MDAIWVPQRPLAACERTTPSVEGQGFCKDYGRDSSRNDQVHSPRVVPFLLRLCTEVVLIRDSEKVGYYSI